MSKKLAIKAQDLTKYYGKLCAVQKVNFEIPLGQTYGLLGPNGAGKTTSVKMLNAIITPSSGEAEVLGFNIKTQKHLVKTNCGFLTETPSLYEKLTAREFLEFVGDLYRVPKTVLNRRIESFLSLFDLKKRENDLLEGYSRGMKQKVCLSATLVHDPEILFLDEPTANLDPISARIVKDIILDLSKKAKKTLFICTHLLEIAIELCDVIGIINKGVLLIEGTPNSVIKSVSASSLEDAYLKILDPSQKDRHKKDYLSWR
jgi:ABC-2 type transport system ATP-binding protein